MKGIKGKILIVFTALAICLCSSITVSAATTYYLLENVTYMTAKGKVNSKLNYKYDKNKNLIQKSQHYISGYDLRNVTKYKYAKKYKNGIRKEANIYLDGKKLYREIFDKNGYVTKFFDGGRLLYSFKYDKYGNTVFKSDNEGKVKFTYSYHSNGIPKKCTGSDGSVIEYYKNGLVKKEKTRYHIFTYTYTYYKNGLPKVMTIKTDNSRVDKQKFTYSKTKISRTRFLHRFYEHLDLVISPALVG